MLEIENFRTIKKIQIKDTNYTVLTGDNEILLKDICEALNIYFNDKKISKIDKELNDKNLIVQNYFSKEKEKTSFKCSILVNDENFNNEFSLGSKTNLYNIFNIFFKNNFLTEPVITTINSLIKELNLEESFVKLGEELTKYSNIKFDFDISELTSVDFIKKINIKIKNDDSEISFLSLDVLEKLKLQLGIVEKNTNILGKNKIFIFMFPEKCFSIVKLKRLKNFLNYLSQENKVIVSTFSKYLFNFSNLDNMNIYFNDKLVNFFSREELLNDLEMNYPILRTKEEIEEKLKFVLNQYLSECFYEITITNKFLDLEKILYLENFEFIFLLLFYIDKCKIPYQKDLIYDNSPFSNYIKEKL